jgi:hypothetical protein
MARWRESSKPSTEESMQCSMTQESWTKFDMDFGQNVNLQHLSMRIELSTRRHITSTTDVQRSFQRLRNVRSLGEMCVVTSKETIQGKLNDRETVGLFFGYPDNNANDAYRIFKIKTKQIIKSRDLVWLNLSYGNWNTSKNNYIQPQDKICPIQKLRQMMLMILLSQRMQL